MFELEPAEARASLMNVSPSARPRLLERTKRIVSPVMLVMLASTLVTICFLKVLPGKLRQNEQTDYFFSYEPIARNFLAGNGLSRDGENLSTEHPPGYPLILAGLLRMSDLLGVSEAATLSAFAVLCMALVSGFVFLLARMFWGTLPAMISALVWMTYPFGLWLTKQPNSELPFMVVLYGGLGLFWYAVLRRLPARAYFLCGLILGGAMLIRPAAMAALLGLSIVLWFTGRDLGRRARGFMIAMLLLGSFIVVLPWEGWVYHKTGRVILLSTNGVNALRDGTTFAADSKGYRQPSNLPADVLVVMSSISEQRDSIVTFGDFRRVLSEQFRQHPGAVVKLFLIKLGRSWYGTDSYRMETPILLVQLAYLLIVGFSFWRAWKGGNRYRAFVICALVMTAAFWGMTFLSLSILRYMVPVVGVLFVPIASLFSQRLASGARPEMQNL